MAGTSLRTKLEDWLVLSDSIEKYEKDLLKFGDKIPMSSSATLRRYKATLGRLDKLIEQELNQMAGTDIDMSEDETY